MHWIALSVVLIFTVTSPAWSTGDPVAGKQKALLCTQCHGPDGHSTQTTIPKLAGQLEMYIVTETIEFQKGIRKDPMMSSIASVVNNKQDIEDIAAYFANQPVMKGISQDNQLSKLGKTLFSSERCDYCHGEGGRRDPPFIGGAPIIGGQHKTYLLKALNDIKAGNRPGDIYGLMEKTLSRLSHEQIEALAEYLSGL